LKIVIAMRTQTVALLLLLLEVAVNAITVEQGDMNVLHTKSHSKKHEHGKMPATRFAKKVQFKHRLRVCNAYPSAAGLDIVKGREKMMSGIYRFKAHDKLTEIPLDYKMCGDFHVPLFAGDQLKFMISGANAGNFEISDLPNNDAVLLLVIERHDTLMNSVAFHSHVFANLLNAQLAVIDTYSGRAHSFIEIADGKTTELLPYNKLVALNHGIYNIKLVNTHKKVKAVEKLVALNRESYVAMRVGVHAQQGPSYPEELVVYPASDPALLGGTSRSSAPFAWLMMVIAMAGLCQ
jgi:hypothetical protein